MIILKNDTLFHKSLLTHIISMNRAFAVSSKMVMNKLYKEDKSKSAPATKNSDNNWINVEFYNDVLAGYFVVSSADDACHSIDDIIVLKAPKAIFQKRIKKFAYTYPDNIIEIINRICRLVPKGSVKSI